LQDYIKRIFILVDIRLENNFIYLLGGSKERRQESVILVVSQQNCCI